MQVVPGGAPTIRPTWSPTVSGMSHQPSPHERMPRSFHIRAYSSEVVLGRGGHRGQRVVDQVGGVGQDREAIPVGGDVHAPSIGSARWKSSRCSSGSSRSTRSTRGSAGRGRRRSPRSSPSGRARPGSRSSSTRRRRGAPNVIATARGSGGGTTLLLNAHLDTVGFGAMADPLGRASRAGRLYGRGAYDMKGGLAACLVAAAEAARRGLRGDVVVTAVVDEELSSVGTQMALKRVRPDAAIVAEPTADARVHRAQGVRRVRGRDAGAGGARLASGSRRRRDREDGPRPRRAGRARPVAARAAVASAARLGLAARGRDRRRHRSSRPTPTAACSRPSAGRFPASTSSRSSRSSRGCSTGSRRGDEDFKGDVARGRRAAPVRGLADGGDRAAGRGVRGRGRARSARRTGRTRR